MRDAFPQTSGGLANTANMSLSRTAAGARRLLSALSSPKPLSPHFVRLTWQQMLEAVAVIHAARIVHGDLKPANFLFVRGTLKLIDFGIARAISSDTTNVYRETQVGTLNYMSPEAIRDTSGGACASGKPRLKLGRASDVWSLGCILYQMVYGVTPFAELQLIAKLQAIVDERHAIRFGRPTPLFGARGGGAGAVDEACVTCLRACLTREPSRRATIDGLLAHAFLVDGAPADGALTEPAPADAAPPPAAAPPAAAPPASAASCAACAACAASLAAFAAFVMRRRSACRARARPRMTPCSSDEGTTETYRA